MELFIRLRDAVFAESGYSLRCPERLKGSNASFVLRNHQGTVESVVPVPGTGSSAPDAPDVFIDLSAYADPEAAKGAVMLMCKHLGRAASGDRRAAEALGSAWALLLYEGIGLKHRSPEEQVALLSNLHGKGRVLGALIKDGTLDALDAPDFGDLVPEALGRAS